jgi:hypothetical protein
LRFLGRERILGYNLIVCHNVRRWFTTGEGQTLAVINGPFEFPMGSSTTDLGGMGIRLPRGLKRLDFRPP